MGSVWHLPDKRNCLRIISLCNSGKYLYTPPKKVVGNSESRLQMDGRVQTEISSGGGGGTTHYGGSVG